MSHIQTQSWLIDRRHFLRGLGSLIALPLYVPTAIFGAMAMTDAPGSQNAPLLLAASALFALAVAPFAMAAALRLAAD